MLRITRFASSLAAAAAVFVAVASYGVMAHAHGMEIAPWLVDGELLAGTNDSHGSGEISPPGVRVFGYDFGDEEDFPRLITFGLANNVKGQAGVFVGNLPKGSQVNFNIISSLLYWNGEGDVSLLPASVGSQIVLDLEDAYLHTLSGTSPLRSGLCVATVRASDGRLHSHLGANISEGADEGIYVYGLTLGLVDGATTYTSDPLYVVMNYGLDEVAHGAAISYVQANVVPEPGSLALVGLGGLGALGLVGSRRRKPAVRS